MARLLVIVADTAQAAINRRDAVAIDQIDDVTNKTNTSQEFTTRNGMQKGCQCRKPSLQTEELGILNK